MGLCCLRACLSSRSTLSGVQLQLSVGFKCKLLSKGVSFLLYKWQCVSRWNDTKVLWKGRQEKVIISCWQFDKFPELFISTGFRFTIYNLSFCFVYLNVLFQVEKHVCVCVHTYTYTHTHLLTMHAHTVSVLLNKE